MSVSVSLYLAIKGIRSQIREHYTLSTQYNLEAIVKAYQDSILYDIRSFSNVGYRLISRSIGELYCDGDAITIAIEDSKIAHIHAEKIKAYMERDVPGEI